MSALRVPVEVSDEGGPISGPRPSSRKHTVAVSPNAITWPAAVKIAGQ